MVKSVSLKQIANVFLLKFLIEANTSFRNLLLVFFFYPQSYIQVFLNEGKFRCNSTKFFFFSKKWFSIETFMILGKSLCGSRMFFFCATHICLLRYGQGGDGVCGSPGDCDDG